MIIIKTQYTPSTRGLGLSRWQIKQRQRHQDYDKVVFHGPGGVASVGICGRSNCRACGVRGALIARAVNYAAFGVDPGARS